MAAILEIGHLAAMVAAGAAAPLGVGRAGTGVHDLKRDGGGIAGFSGLIVGAVLLRPHELEALAAAQVVVVVAWEAGPELGVVVAGRSREITVQCRIRGITTKIWICFAERVALLGIARVEFIRRRAQPVESECAGSARGQPKMCRARVVPWFVVGDAMDFRPLARGARLAIDHRAMC